MKVVILSTATSYTGGAIITLLNVLPLLKKEGVEPYFILKGHGQLEDVLRNRKIPYSVMCAGTENEGRKKLCCMESEMFYQSDCRM